MNIENLGQGNMGRNLEKELDQLKQLNISMWAFMKDFSHTNTFENKQAEEVFEKIKLENSPLLKNAGISMYLDSSKISQEDKEKIESYPREIAALFSKQQDVDYQHGIRFTLQDGKKLIEFLKKLNEKTLDESQIESLADFIDQMDLFVEKNFMENMSDTLPQILKNYEGLANAYKKLNMEMQADWIRSFGESLKEKYYHEMFVLKNSALGIMIEDTYYEIRDVYDDDVGKNKGGKEIAAIYGHRYWQGVKENIEMLKKLSENINLLNSKMFHKSLEGMSMLLDNEAGEVKYKEKEDAELAIRQIRKARKNFESFLNELLEKKEIDETTKLSIIKTKKRINKKIF